MILQVENALNKVVLFHFCNKSDMKLSRQMAQSRHRSLQKKLEAKIDVGFGDG
jgi:hypothetical protein